MRRICPTEKRWHQNPAIQSSMFYISGDGRLSSLLVKIIHWDYNLCSACKDALKYRICEYVCVNANPSP